INNVGDILETYWPSVLPGNRHRSVFRGFHQLPGGLNVVSLMRTVQRTRREVHVPVLDCICDFVDPDSPGSHFAWIHLHVDRVLLLPPNVALPPAPPGPDPLPPPSF